MRDLRYAWKMLLRAPGFAAVAILTLALGIGANTAIFSIVGPMLLEPLPFPQSRQIVDLAHKQHGQFSNGLSGSEGLYLLAHQRAFQAAALVDAFDDSNLSAAGAGGGVAAVRVAAVKVTHGFFKVWGVAPARGRDFTAEDDAAGAPSTAILSNGLWRSQFGADPEVVGRTVRLNGAVSTIIGVMPASFVALTQNQLNPAPTQLWTDMQPTATSLAPLGPNLDVIARLAPGWTLAQAQADMTALKLSFNQIHPQVAAHADWGVESMHDAVAGGTEQPLLLLLGAVGLVLLIACANLANLLLARATGRRREMAIRAALGANPGRILRQLLTESLLLAVLGAGLGLLLAWWWVPLLERMTPAALALPLPGGLNGAALAFTVGITILAALLFGLAPAWGASRMGLQGHLKDRAATGGGGRARGALIVGEVALAFLLLAGAGLLATSLVKLHQVNPGFDTRDVLTVQTALTGTRAASDAATTRYTEAVLARLRRLPGVTGAASITGVPLTRAMNYPVEVPGHETAYAAEWRAISPGFFGALRIRIARGRDFNAADNAAGPQVAIASAAFVRHYWPHQSGLGEVIGIPDPDNGKNVRMLQIVGIAADVHENGVDSPPPLTVYVPQAQASDAINKLVNHWFAMGFVIRGQGAGLGAAVRQAFAQVDRNQPIFHLRPLDAVLGSSLGQYTFMGELLGAFAGLALILGAIGIYGVLAYAVAQQRRDIGVRMALGAERGVILRQYLGYGLKLTGLGLVLGILGAVALMRLLQGMLFGVAPTDPRVLAATAVALLLLAALASLRPAWVATRVDPLQALRME